MSRRLSGVACGTKLPLASYRSGAPRISRASRTRLYSLRPAVWFSRACRKGRPRTCSFHPRRGKRRRRTWCDCIPFHVQDGENTATSHDQRPMISDGENTATSHDPRRGSWDVYQSQRRGCTNLRTKKPVESLSTPHSGTTSRTQLQTIIAIQTVMFMILALTTVQGE